MSLITLNSFGTPTPRTRRRLLTLAQLLNRSDADVVCLQEVQANSYHRLLLRACDTFPFRASERFVHAPKGGLLTLARLPVIDHGYTLYRDRGNMYTPALADWILHKGVLWTELLHGSQKIVVLNTHLSANYRADWHNENRYLREERAQLVQLAEIVAAQDPAAIVLVAGDFNVPRGSAVFQDFLHASGLRDPMAADARPTYRGMAGMPQRFSVPIDFTLVRAPATMRVRFTGDLCFAEAVPLIDGRAGFLSDHIGVALQLSWDAM